MSDRPENQHPAHVSHERMSMPENHLDTVVATNSIDTTKRASLMTKIISVVLLPLFLISGFTIAYTTAQSAPKPHDMALTIAGPAATTKSITAAIEDRSASAFDITRTTSASEARRAVGRRDAVGAVIIDGDQVTTVTASAAGRIAVAPIQEVGQQVAKELGATVKVVDVAPVTDEDTSGTALFYFILLCTVGGYLSLTVISQVLPRARTRTMIATAAGAGVLAPIIGFAMISIFVGDFGATFGDIAAVIGVGMLYTFTVGLVATFYTRMLGQAAIFAVLVTLMFLNFPSTGGSAPESMLPGFWQVVHNGWLGSGAFEATRSIVYFHGEQAGRWIGQLSIWTGAALVLTVLAGVVHSRKRAKLEAEEAANPGASSRSSDVALVGGAM